MHPRYGHITEHLIPSLAALRRRCLRMEREHAQLLATVQPEAYATALNLLHYLALRQQDMRDLQEELAAIGLSRLARCEAHVLASIDAVLDALHGLVNLPAAGRRRKPPISLPENGRHLAQHANRLLGHGAHGSRIMVTMPSEAASQPELIHELLAAGMEVMRINCAHDDAEAWQAMVRHLRTAERALGRSCKVYADLAGPKLRTGQIRPVGRLIDFSPRRDAWGRVLQPAAVWLTPRDNPEAPDLPVDAVLPLSAAFLGKLKVNDRLELEDCRGVVRALAIEQSRGRSWLAHCWQHVYLGDGARCLRRRSQGRKLRDVIGPLPERVVPILLHVGDRLLLVAGEELGELADGVRPARIPCSLDAVFEAARPGQAVWFDDGRIGAQILANHGREIELEISHAAPRGSRLRPEKGINLPDTALAVPALTDKDLLDLKAVVPLVDMVGLSFVRSVADVEALQAQLRKLKATHLGTVLKIETRQGFENLASILLASLRHPPVGVMVARGDLAVEVGFERLAEVQEEILWLCEAAQVPVIWATQVLDSMAQRGLPSRAEVSDAALAVRAECVMLNKGPYIVETTRFLADILQRMRGHQQKNRPVMRPLAVSRLTRD